MLGNVPSMFSNALGRLRERDKETGLSPLMRGAAALDPLIMPSMRGGDAIIRQGQQYVASQGRNATITELKKRAEAGDTVAQRYLQGIESGALDMKTGFAGYLNEVAANERAQREMNMRMSLAKASAAKKTTYRTMTGAELNAATGSGLPADKLYQIGSDGSVKQVGGAGPSVTVQGPEKEYQKKIGGAAADREIKIMDAGSNARATLRTISIQENLIQDPSFQSGTGQALFNNASQLMERLGIGESDIASQTAFQAFANKSVLDSLGGSLGTGVSNADVTFINNTVENLNNSGEGIRLLLALRRKLAERDILTANEMYKWKQRTGKQMLDADWEMYIQEWAEQNPLFAPSESYL
jgi:hypothetical protein